MQSQFQTQEYRNAKARVERLARHFDFMHRVFMVDASAGKSGCIHKGFR